MAARQAVIVFLPDMSNFRRNALSGWGYIFILWRSINIHCWISNWKISESSIIDRTCFGSLCKTHEIPFIIILQPFISNLYYYVIVSISVALFSHRFIVTCRKYNFVICGPISLVCIQRYVLLNISGNSFAISLLPTSCAISKFHMINQ